MRRYIAFLLMLTVFLNFSLAGCDTDTSSVPATTQPPATTAPLATAPTETEPPIDPKAIYEEATQAYSDNVRMEVTLDRQIKIADTVISTSTEQTITYLNIGTDRFSALVNESVDYGSYTLRTKEIFDTGKVYATMDDAYFSMELSAEDYMSRYTPPAMLDVSLYDTVTYDERTGIISFTDAAGLESWVLDEEVNLLDVRGSATVTDGTVSKATYTVSYAVGGATITLDVQQDFKELSNTKFQAPSDASKYLPVEQLDAIKLVDQVYGYLLAANIMDTMILESTVSQAGGMVLNSQDELCIYNVGDNPLLQRKSAVFYMDARNKTETSEVLEVFRDGQYTITHDNGKPSSDEDVTVDMMYTYYLQLLTESALSASYLQTATGTDMGGILLAEFTCNDALGEAICAEVCYDLFGNGDLLNNLASAYRNKTLEFYVAADKYTGLPTAMGLTYEGIHTIEGTECLLSRQVDYRFDLAGLGVYEKITDEMPPETEPEEKATPLLYHVTGPDGEEMWLFGTIHVGDARTGFLPQEVYDAFAASDALAIECNTTAFEEQLEDDEKLSEEISDYYYYSDGSTVKDHITDEALYDAAVKMLKATGNYNMNSQYLKPSIWAQNITNAFLSYGNTLTSNRGVESRLEKLAKEQNKPILEVESVTFQISMTTGYSDELQEQLLAEAVCSPTRDYWDSVLALYEKWCRGDEAELIDAIRDDTSEMTEEELALYNEYNNAISVDRNEGMHKAAIGYLKSGDTVFFSVGLAHLLAENGLVFSLREAGYTVELVKYK